MALAAENLAQGSLCPMQRRGFLSEPLCDMDRFLQEPLVASLLLVAMPLLLVASCY